MSRANPFAFFAALEKMGLVLRNADTASASDIYKRPRPFMRQLEQQGYSVEMAKPDVAVLQSFGFAVNTIFDVGVDAGTPLIYNAFPDAQFVLIDPLSESRDRVAGWKGKINFDFHICGVGADASTMEIQIPRKPNKVMASRASLLQFEDDNAAMFQEFETRQVDIRTLDSISAQYEGPFGLKIDTEGFELQVVKGARQTLKNCAFVIAEVSVKRRFRNSYKFSEFIAEMGANGFEIIDFLKPLRPDSVDCDILFAPFASPIFDFQG